MPEGSTVQVGQSSSPPFVDISLPLLLNLFTDKFGCAAKPHEHFE